VQVDVRLALGQRPGATALQNCHVRGLALADDGGVEVVEQQRKGRLVERVLPRAGDFRAAGDQERGRQAAAHQVAEPERERQLPGVGDVDSHHVVSAGPDAGQQDFLVVALERAVEPLQCPIIGHLGNGAGHELR
jgi:hypothetical protein